jgi:hypothetical protein
MYFFNDWAPLAFTCRKNYCQWPVSVPPCVRRFKITPVFYVVQVYKVRLCIIVKKVAVRSFAVSKSYKHSISVD